MSANIATEKFNNQIFIKKNKKLIFNLYYFPSFKTTFYWDWIGNYILIKYALILLLVMVLIGLTLGEKPLLMFIFTSTFFEKKQ